MLDFQWLERQDVKELETTSSGRRYKTPVGILPSVTTVLSTLETSDGLQRWIDRVGEKEAERQKNQAAGRGTVLHHAIEEWIIHQKHTVSTPFDESLYQQIKKSLDPISTVYGLELPVYSGKLGAAGRLDLFAKYNGIPSVIDFKTSVSRKREDWIKNYFLQCSCYAMMLYEMYSIKVPQIVVLMATEDEDPCKFVKKTQDYIPEVVKIFTDYKKSQQGA